MSCKVHAKLIQPLIQPAHSSETENVLIKRHLCIKYTVARKKADHTTNIIAGC